MATIKFLFCTLIAALIATNTCDAVYREAEKARAQAILDQAEGEGPYAPKLLMSAADNTRGHADIFADEYAIYVAADTVANPMLDLLAEVNAMAYPDEGERPEMAPHVVVAHGMYRESALPELYESLKAIAGIRNPQKIMMASEFSIDQRGHMVLNVLEEEALNSQAFLFQLNKEVTRGSHPSGPRKTVLDDIRSETISLRQMTPGKAWRADCLPRMYDPNIVVAYTLEDDSFLRDANAALNRYFPYRYPSFNADALSVAKTDVRGNIMEVVRSFPFASK